MIDTHMSGYVMVGSYTVEGVHVVIVLLHCCCHNSEKKPHNHLTLSELPFSFPLKSKLRSLQCMQV